MESESGWALASFSAVRFEGFFGLVAGYLCCKKLINNFISFHNVKKVLCLGLYASGHSLHVRTHKLSRVAGNAPRRLNRCILKQRTATRFRMTVQKYCFLLGLIGKRFPNLSESCPNYPKVTYRFRFMFLCSPRYICLNLNHTGGSTNESPVCIMPINLFARIGTDRCTLYHFHPSRELCHRPL